MSNTLQKVQLSEISLSELFFVTTEGRDNDALQKSIASCGLLQPPCLWRHGEEAAYMVICGYRRLQAIRNLGWQQLSAWVFDPAIPQARLLECALQDNLAHRKFNPIETAHALKRLMECFPRDSVISEWLPRFGLSASGRMLERFLSLCILEQESRAALIAGSLTESSALRLCSYSAEDRLAVFALMQQLHLSTGKQAELLECLEDLSRRDKSALRDVAAAADIEQVCSDERLNRVQKTAQVRHILRTRRFPRLHAAEDRVASVLKELQLPAGIRVMPPPHFEGRTFKAEMTFTSADELLQHGRELQRAAGNKALKRLCAESKGGTACTDDTKQ